METHRVVMELGPVIGYGAAMVVFVAGLIAWDVRQCRKQDETDARELRDRYGWPRRQS